MAAIASSEAVGAGLVPAPRDAPGRAPATSDGRAAAPRLPREIVFGPGPWPALHASAAWRRHLPLLAAAADPLPGEGAWTAAVLARSGCLRAALSRGRTTAACAAAAAIAGLGEGSTPAGDDYLMGALHALWASGPAGAGMAPRLARAAAPRTTTRSAAWLERAGAGAAGPGWRALLGALLSTAVAEPIAAAAAPSAGEPAATLPAAIAAVRSLGHTSGAWSLRGFADTLEALPT